MDEYDVGLLNDWGGGNVAWWHDYLRYEIARANSHWIQQTESLRAENEALRAALQAIVEPFSDLNFVDGGKLLTYIHDTATAALAADGNAPATPA